MRRYIEGLSPRAEFAIVVALAFGYPIVGNLAATLLGRTAGHISESHLEVLIVYELAILAVLIPFLRLRGWTSGRIGLRPGWKETGIGFLLMPGAYLAAYVSYALAASLFPGLVQSAQHPDFVTPGFAVATLVATSALNGFFEEAFVCAYVISALKERQGFWTSVNVSIALRLSYHLYQGPIGIVGIVPIGFVFGLYYARTGRLWPLVVAHALIDLVGLASHVAG